ncbi:MAG: hypothetical protein B9S32_00195 [Verrucomicrobia bacterium Tous-C9LFEB]|nr:MAG: hypothetical protein B9S32_00195 [Verrucomicrobia bacterium Tous-C9LFEB]
MTADFETFITRTDADWKAALVGIASSRKDVLLLSGEVTDPTEAGRRLQAHALANATLGIVGATTLTPFPHFDRREVRVFSAGRRILSPLGVAAERINRFWGEAPAVAEASPLTEVESVWGSAVLVKRSLLDKIAGFDAAYLGKGKPAVPNLLVDDLCVQARQAGFTVACAPEVTATVSETSVEYPQESGPAYAHWQTKWGWDPLIPNIYHLRQKWNGSSIGQPMIEDLLDVWDAEEPSVEVILQTGNSLSNLQTCLSKLAQAQYPRLRVHLLLNGSGEPVTRYLSKLTGAGYPFFLDIVRSPVAVGVPAGWNWLLSRCTAPVVVRMDDDVELPPEGLRHLVGTLRRFPLAGAVSPAVLVPREDGQTDYLSPLRLFPKMASSQPSEKMAPWRSLYLTNFLSGPLVVYRKKAIDRAGVFDLHFSSMQNESMDHGLAVRAEGYDLIVDGRVTVVQHTAGISAGGQRGVEACRAQRQFFCQKWGIAPAVLESALDRDGRIIEV